MGNCFYRDEFNDDKIELFQETLWGYKSYVSSGICYTKDSKKIIEINLNPNEPSFDDDFVELIKIKYCRVEKGAPAVNLPLRTRVKQVILVSND